MKVAVYGLKNYETKTLKEALADFDTDFFQVPLNIHTTNLIKNHEAVVLFVNDDCNQEVVEMLHQNGVKHICLRSAGFNNVDLDTCKKLDITVSNVPEYSPFAIAEHTIALILTLNRKIIKAHNRLYDLNFSLDGLVGFDLHGKTVGVIGTGNIGEKVIAILNGFGCHILAYDLYPKEELKEKVTYTTLDHLFKASDIVTLHLPLTNESKYIINENSINLMKDGVMLINTSRGGLVNTKHVINALKKKKIGYLGLDVYEEEKGLFFEDFSEEDVLQDDLIARLLTFKNVLITSHQAFLTKEALKNIAETTRFNLLALSETGKSPNLVG